MLTKERVELIGEGPRQLSIEVVGLSGWSKFGQHVEHEVD